MINVRMILAKEGEEDASTHEEEVEATDKASALRQIDWLMENDPRFRDYTLVSKEIIP